MPDHVLSRVTRHEEANMAPPEPRHEVIQPGDTAVVLQGPYKGAEALIEWMDTSGTQAWIYVQEKDAGVPSGSKAGVRQSIMVTVNVHDIRVQLPTNTLSFSRERGYDVCAGDGVDVARGEWFRSRGVVQRVCFDKGHLDLVCDAVGQRVSIVCQLLVEVLIIHLDHCSDYILPQSSRALGLAAIAMGRP